MAIQYALDDVERIFGVTYTQDQRIALENIPFSEEVLKECAETHMLFPGYPLSLLDVRARFTGLFHIKTGGWYADQAFAKDVQVRPSWHLLRMEQVPESFNKSWDEQCSLLTEGEEVPSSAVVTVATILHFLATGQRLFERCYVRTADRGSDDDRFSVGDFDADGLSVRSYWDGHRTPRLGLAASRKF